MATVADDRKDRPPVRVGNLSLTAEINALNLGGGTPPQHHSTLSTGAAVLAAAGTTTSVGPAAPGSGLTLITGAATASTPIATTVSPAAIGATVISPAGDGKLTVDGAMAQPRLTVKANGPGGVVIGASGAGGVVNSAAGAIPVSPAAAAGGNNGNGNGGGGSPSISIGAGMNVGVALGVASSPTDGKFGVGAKNMPANAGTAGRNKPVNYDPAPLMRVDLIARQGHVRVDVALRVLRVHEIDHATQTFTIDAITFLEWSNPGLIGLDGLEGSRRAKEWVPRLAVKNVVKSHTYSSDCQLVDVRLGRVRQTFHQKLTLSEPFDLRAFPFDRHTLSVVFRAEHSANELELCVNKKIDSVVECFGGGRGGEYVLTHSHASTAHRPSVQDLHSESFEMNSELLDGTRHSELVCSMTVVRNTHLAALNIWAVSFLLGLSLFFSYFWVTGDDGLTAAAALSARLSTSYMVLIAACAYRIYLGVVSPRVQYKTIADSHFFAVFVFIFLMMCETALISALFNNGHRDVANTVDIVCRYALPGCWVLWNVGVWSHGARIRSGAVEWDPADGVQRPWSNLEYASRKWVLPEPVSARAVNRSAAPKPAQKHTFNVASAAGSGFSSAAHTLGLPSTKTTTRDGRPVAGAKPSLAAPPVHKPQPHNQPGHHRGSPNAKGDNERSDKDKDHSKKDTADATAFTKSKRTNSGSVLPSQVGSKASGKLAVHVQPPGK